MAESGGSVWGTIEPTRREGTEVTAPRSAGVRALQKLQQLLRSEPPPAFGDHGMTLNLRPPGLSASGDVTASLIFSRNETTAVRETAAAIERDEAFGHLKKAEDQVWEFATEVSLDKTRDHVATFVEKHARTIKSRDCFFVIEHLKTSASWSVGKVTFLPPQSALVPAHPWSTTTTSVATVAKVGTRGTSLTLMAERGRAEVA